MFFMESCVSVFRDALNLALVLCRSLFVCLSLSLWPLNCQSFFDDILFLTTPNNIFTLFRQTNYSFTRTINVENEYVGKALMKYD